MIELKKDEFLKINQNSYLCYIPVDDQGGKYSYVVAINSYPSCYEFQGLEIYGIGENSEIALLMAIGNLTDCGLKGIPLKSIEDMNIKELFEHIQNEDGYIHDSPICIEREKDSEAHGYRLGVKLEKNKAIGCLS